jgi:tRNA threonylcarbamoyladenosine biosynthesis protein TsaB
MKILALEFSPCERGIAVMRDQEVLGFAIDRAERGMRAIELIARALEQAQLSASEIDCLAVGLGPGSYAGIRTAIAIAQGWQLARGVKLLGVNSADAVARQISSRNQGRNPVPAIANIVCDAQRGEVYAARYEVGKGIPIPLGGFELLASAEEERRRSEGEMFFKADDGAWRLGHEPILLSDARVVGAIAAERSDFLTAEQLEPIYLRRAEFVKASRARFEAT